MDYAYFLVSSSMKGLTSKKISTQSDGDDSIRELGAIEKLLGRLVPGTGKVEEKIFEFVLLLELFLCSFLVTNYFLTNTISRPPSSLAHAMEEHILWRVGHLKTHFLRHWCYRWTSN